MERKKQVQSFKEGIGYLIDKTAVYLKVYGSQFFNSKNFGITLEQFIALVALFENDNICQRDLSKLILKDRSNTSRILNILEEKGLVERAIDTKQKRLVKKVCLTQKGRNLILEIGPEIKEAYQKLIAGISDEEMAVIKNNETVVMVDSGSVTNDTAYIFESYVNKENIQKIDILVISHFHSDHVNGILEIAKICDINYLIYAYPYDFISEEYIKIMEGLEKENIKHVIVKAGDNISINGTNINILSPEIKYLKVSGKIDENENVNSLALNISVNNKNYLFMGDTTKEAEEKIIENLKKQNIKEIEILKVGHHGSKTSTSEKFIQSILPNYSVISCKNKVYNHPSKETINTLNKYRIKTYITEKVGGIKYNI